MKYIIFFILGLIIYKLLNNVDRFNIGGAYIYSKDKQGNDIFLPGYQTISKRHNMSDAIELNDYYEEFKEYKFKNIYENIKADAVSSDFKIEDIVLGKSYFFRDDMANEIFFINRDNNYIISNNGIKTKEIYNEIDATYLFNGIIDLKTEYSIILNDISKYKRLFDRMEGILMLRDVLPSEFNWRLGNMRSVEIEGYGDTEKPDIRLLINVYFDDFKDDKGEPLTLFMFTNLRRNAKPRFYFSPGIMMGIVTTDKTKMFNILSQWYIKGGYNEHNMVPEYSRDDKQYNYLKSDNLGIPILQTIAEYLTENYMELFKLTPDMFADKKIETMGKEEYAIYPHFEERLITQRTETPFIPLESLGPFTKDDYLYIKLGTFKINIFDNNPGDNIFPIIKKEDDNIILNFELNSDDININFKNITNIKIDTQQFILNKKKITYIIYYFDTDTIGNFGFGNIEHLIKDKNDIAILEDIHKYVHT